MRSCKSIKWPLAFLAAAIVGAMTGCDSLPGLHSSTSQYLKPTVAVMKFENRAPFEMSWNLGDGMADMLVDRLVATGRFHVIERPELRTLLKEQQLQGSGITRPENKSQPGRIKNVQYWVKGTITDFGHVSTTRGFLGLPNWTIFGGGNKAVISMTLYVVDNESGEIICSKSLQQSVRAKDLSVKAVYQGVAFGGSTFYRTPLGQATGKVIDEAVRDVTSCIANQKWEPKIAAVQAGGTVYINGGKDRSMKTGAQYDVLQAGQAIIDPDTGDIIGRQESTVLGRVRIGEIFDHYCTASVISGEATNVQVGQRCRIVKD